MSIRIASLLPVILLAACGMEPPPGESTTDQDLTANEIDSSWFSDAAFTNQIGETDLYCTAGHGHWGVQSSRYVARFTWPCNGAGGNRVSCYQLTQSPEGSSYDVVECPAGLF